MIFNKRIIFFLLFLFFLIRLISINNIPIFNDEAIYLRWGNQFIENFGKGLVPVSIDGKQAGTPILFGLAQVLTIDPLIAGRLVSVMFSLITFLSILKLSEKYFEGKLLIWEALILIFCPYLLLFDRMALPDGIVTALFSLSLLIFSQLMEKPGLVKSILMGIILACGWWMKSTMLLAFIPIFTIYGYKFITKAAWRKDYLFSIIALLVTFCILILPILQNPLYAQMPHFEYTRIFTFVELIRFPVNSWLNNLLTILLLLLIYITPLLLLIFILGIKNIIQKKFAYPLIWFFLPLVFEIFFLKNIDSRYVLILIPIVLLLTLEGLKIMDNKIKRLVPAVVGSSILMGLILAFFPLSFYAILSLVPRVRGDFAQYVTGWTSGYGVREAADYLKEKAPAAPVIVVFVRMDSGNPEDGVLVYLNKEKNIRVLPVNFLGDIMQNRDKLQLSSDAFYFVSRGNQLAGLGDKLKVEAKFKKPIGEEFVGVYKISL